MSMTTATPGRGETPEERSDETGRARQLEREGPDAALSPWTAQRFFHALDALGPLRVISVCGPSVFEAICRIAPFEVGGGFLNIVSDAYHWHLSLARFGHLRAVDRVHARSGRRVLFFELREDAEREPFLRIYLFRPHGEDFAPGQVEGFEALWPVLSNGVAVLQAEEARGDDAR